MDTNVQTLCKQVIEAYGGLGMLQRRRNRLIIDELNLITPPFRRRSNNQRPNGLPASAGEAERIPFIPITRKVYINTRERDSIQLRVDMLSEYGQMVLLITEGGGSQTIRYSPDTKQFLINTGMADHAHDRTEPLPQTLVVGNLDTYVQATPLEFLMDYKNRNAKYKGIVRASIGMLEIGKRDCHVLEFSGPEGRGLYELEIDVDTKLCFKMRSGTTELMYLDHRQIDGIMVAHIGKAVLGGKVISTSKLQRIEFNREFPPETFTKA